MRCWYAALGALVAWFVTCLGGPAIGFASVIVLGVFGTLDKGGDDDEQPS